MSLGLVLEQGSTSPPLSIWPKEAVTSGSPEVQVQAGPPEGPGCALTAPWGLPSEDQWLAAERLNLY